MALSLRNRSLAYVRKVAVLIIGGTVLLLGIIMIVTPGPAFLVIPAGLAILAIEFAWARRLLKRSRDYVAAKVATSPAKEVGSTDPKPGGKPS